MTEDGDGGEGDHVPSERRGHGKNSMGEVSTIFITLLFVFRDY